MKPTLLGPSDSANHSVPEVDIISF